MEKLAPSLDEQIRASLGQRIELGADAFLDAMDEGQTDGVSCWRSNLVERREGSDIEGVGLFATDDIEEGSLIAIKQGRVISDREVKDNSEVIQGSQQQISANQFIAGLTAEEVDKNLVGYNHSCDPNAKVVLFKGQPLSLLVARKPIKAGEEVTVDYSVSQKTETHLLRVCRCGAADCRGYVAPLWDWENEGFQDKYGDEIVWYIRDEIDARDSLPPEEALHKRKYDENLKMAAIITLVDDDIKEIEAKRQEILDSSLIIWRPLLKRAFANSLAGEELRELEARLVEAATYFCILCPFGNIEEAGVDKSGLQAAIDKGSGEAIKYIMPQARDNITKVTSFARQLDRLFNP
jgi:uncharacterized protein